MFSHISPALFAFWICMKGESHFTCLPKAIFANIVSMDPAIVKLYCNFAIAVFGWERQPVNGHGKSK